MYAMGCDSFHYLNQQRWRKKNRLTVVLTGLGEKAELHR